MAKRLLNVVLSFVLVVGLMPTSAFAAVGSASGEASSSMADGVSSGASADLSAGASAGALSANSSDADEDALASEGDGGLVLTFEGEGTEASPYLLATAEDLFVFATLVNTQSPGEIWAVLTQDIDLSTCADTAVWKTPIGLKSANAFSGHFDGQGHAITNLKISESTSATYAHKAIFGQATNAEIKNFSVSGTVSAGQYSAGAVARADKSTISGVINHCSVTSAQQHVGGVVGFAAETNVINCGNDGAVTAYYSTDSANPGYSCSGGVIGGFASRDSSTTYEITGCWNAGTITSTTRQTGGVVGSVGAYNVSITDCCNKGSLVYQNENYYPYLGGIAGLVGTAPGWYPACVEEDETAASLESVAEPMTAPTSYEVRNCYSIGAMDRGTTASYPNNVAAICSISAASISATSVTNNYYLDGIANWGVGASYSSGSVVTSAGVVETATQAQMQATGFAAKLGTNWADDSDGLFNGGWPYLRWQNPSLGYVARISVTLADAGNDDGENGIDVVVTCNGEQVDFEKQEGATSAGVTLTKENLPNNSTYEYEISKKGYVAATGSFSIEGKGANVAIALQPVDYQYTIHATPADATVTFKKNGITQAPASTDIDDDLATYVFGGLHCADELTCSVERYGYDSENVTLDKIDYSDVDWTFDLKPQELHNVDLQVTVPEGLVSVASGLGADGGAGGNDDAAVDALAAQVQNGAVPLSGINELDEAQVEKLAETVSAHLDFPVVFVYCRTEGSFVGDIVYSSLSDPNAGGRTAEGAFDYQTQLGNGTFEAVAYYTGCTTLKKTFTIADADVTVLLPLESAMTDAWDGVTAETGWYLTDPTADTFTLMNAADLAGLSLIVAGAATDHNGNAISETFAGKTVQLGADIDLGGTKETPAWWTPIGVAKSGSGVAGQTFAGTFDGCGHTIYNLLVGKGESTSRIHSLSVGSGLFSYLTGTADNPVTVRDLTIVNAQVSRELYCTVPAAGAGVIASKATYATFENVRTQGGSVSWSDSYNAGGFVGMASTCTFTDCSNGADVTAKYHVGGLAGALGFANYDYTTENHALRCSNTGNVTACDTMSSVVTYSAGGLFGNATYCGRTVIDACYNAGNVSGDVGSIGGIIGCVGSTSSTQSALCILNCYNKGDLKGGPTKASSAGHTVGGIVGFIGLTAYPSRLYGNYIIANCYNIGHVGFADDAVGSNYAGGIAGETVGASVANATTISNNFSEASTAERAIGYDKVAALAGVDADGKVVMQDSESMKGEAFAETLGDAFSPDTIEVNEGYPILRWQDSSAAYAVDINVSLNNTVNDDFEFAQVDGVWVIAKDGTAPTIVVKDASGKVVLDENLGIVLDEATGAYSYVLKTELPVGDYTFEISKKGYCETRQQTDEGTTYVSSKTGAFTVAQAACAVNAELVATRYEYKITVTTDKKAEPLSTTDVEVRLGGSDGEIQKPASTVDNVRTYYLYNGDYWVRSAQYGYNTIETPDDELVAVSYGDTASELDHTAAARHAITVTASPAAGTGAFGDSRATIKLWCATRTFDAETLMADETGAVTFSFEDLPDDTYYYEVFAGGYARVKGQIALSADTTLPLTLQKATYTGNADTDWYDADATSFTLVTPDELAGLAAIVNGTAEGIAKDSFAGKTVSLAASMSLAGYEWTPIGSYTGGAFEGTFDGADHKISNMTVNSTFYAYGALFGSIKNATVKNLIVAGKVTGQASGLIDYSAGIAATASGTSVTFENVGSEVDISVGVTSEGIAGAGGMVGWAVCPVTMTNCYNKGAIVATSNKLAYLGGLIAYCSAYDGTIAISDCYNAGAVSFTAVNASSTAGGFVGTSGSVIQTIKNSYSAGPVSGVINGEAVDTVGAFVGSSNESSSSVTNAYRLDTACERGGGSTWKGTDASKSVTADFLKSTEALTVLNYGLSSPAFVQATGTFPRLSWEHDLLSLTVKAMPDKTSYNDRENFDSTGLVLEATYDGFDPVQISGGWLVTNGTKLAPGQTSVSVTYSGMTVEIPITVTQVEHATVDTVSVEFDGLVEGEAASTNLSILSKVEDESYSASLKWTKAGEDFTGVFEAKTFYRAEITITTRHDDGAWFFLPDGVTVNIATADGTEAISEVLYPTRSADGRTWTASCTFEALDCASDVDQGALHLYYEGDADAPRYATPLEEETALTLSVEGAQTNFTLADLEQKALDEDCALTANYSNYDSDEANPFSISERTGVKLYSLLAETLGADAADETPVILTATDDTTLETSLGNLRKTQSNFTDDGSVAALVPSLLAFGSDGNPLAAAGILNPDDQGPLMVVTGQSAFTSAAIAMNVRSITVPTVIRQATQNVTFSASCLGEDLTGVDFTVCDSWGNAMPQMGDGVFALPQNADYSYTVSKAGYTTKQGTFALGSEDQSFAIELLETFSGTLQVPEIDADGYYLIYNADELMWWAENAAAGDKVRLMNDVAINDGVTYDAATSYRWPVETFGSAEDAAFNGTFDGNGHTIYGFYIYRENTIDIWSYWDGSVGMLSDNVSQIGLFGYASGATIKNLGVEGRIDVLDRPDSMYASWMQIGGLVGYAIGCTIQNCTTNVGINHSMAEGGGILGGVPYDGWPEKQDARIGGIVGTAACGSSPMVIENCYSRGSAISSGARSVRMGGIAGEVRSYGGRTCEVSDCYSTMNLTGNPYPSTWSGNLPTEIGGIIGNTYLSTSDSSIAASGLVAINGTLTGSGISSARANRVVSATEASTSNLLAVDGLVIQNASYDKTADGYGLTITADQTLHGSTYRGIGWTENESSEVTETSAGWQFPSNALPRLYWEDASLSLSPDQTYNAVETETGEYHGDDTTFTEYAPPGTLSIGYQVYGHDAQTRATMTSQELRKLSSHDTLKYSGVSSSGTYGRAVTEYVTFDTLLQSQGLVFGSGDYLLMQDSGWAYSYDRFFKNARYYFPDWADGGTDEGGVEVPAALVIKSYGATITSDGDEYLDYLASSSTDYLYAYMICFGQETPDEYNVGYWAYQQTGVYVGYDDTAALNVTVKSDLSTWARQAKSDMAGVEVATAPSQVIKGTPFVSQDVMDTYRDALDEVQNALSDSATTNGEAMDALEKLQEARDDFKADVRLGTGDLDYGFAEVAVKSIDEDLAMVDSGEVAVSDDGAGLEMGQQYVSSTLYQQIVDVKAACEALPTDQTLSQAEVEEMGARAIALEQEFLEGITTKMPTKGDLNNNGAVNIVDAQIILDLANGRYAAGTPGAAALIAAWGSKGVTLEMIVTFADVNEDGATDAADARATQHHIHTDTW